MEKKHLFHRIGHIHVPTTDLDASIAWYTRLLSFKRVSRFTDRGSELAVLHHPHMQAIALLLIHTADKQRLEISRNGKPFPLFTLYAPDIDEAYRHLTANGVEADGIHVLGDGECKYFYFRDPEGHLLEASWSIWDPQDELKPGF